MAIFRRRSKDGPLLPESDFPTPGPFTPRTVTAAAMPMAGPGVRLANKARKQSSNLDWQKQGWYYYDVIGELRAPLVWIANAVSQADIHATEIDPATGKPTGPSDDPIAQQAAAMVLGGAAKRATLLKVLALCWQVPGEAWIVVTPQGAGQPDKWIVLPPAQVTTKGNGDKATWQYRDPRTGIDVPLDERARLFRIWSPHPADFIQADSAVRPALPICHEIERCSQTIAAQLNSRIAIAPIMLLADELDFPKGEHETSAMALIDEVLAATEASIGAPGTPAALSPLGINAPSELIANGGALAFVAPTTEFVQGLDELREKGLNRLFGTLDMPRSVAAGTQTESNHWGAWQVEESTYKIYIEPLLQALGDAITTEWYRHALIAMGKTSEQAERFEIGWDTTKIVARPDDTENLRDLHNRLLISDEYMLAENGVPETAQPDEAEYARRLLEKLVLASPAILSEPGVAEALGMAELADARGTETPAMPPASADDTTGQRALPATQNEEPEPEPVPEGLTAAAELLVFDALSRAGGRLLTRETRGQFTTTEKHELYMRIGYDNDRIDSLLEGSFTFADRAAKTWGVDPETFTAKLRSYATYCLFRRVLPERDDLREWLR